MKRPNLLRLSILLAFAGCASPQPSDDDQRDPLPPYPSCGEISVRAVIPIPTIDPGDATVAAIEDSTSGDVELRLTRTDHTDTLTLPATPALAVGDEVWIDVDGLGVSVWRGEQLVAYVGGTGNDIVEGRSPFADALTDGSAPIVLGDLESTLRPTCVQEVMHTSPTFCGTVGLVAYELSIAGTPLVPNETVELELADGTRVAAVHHNIHNRDDRVRSSDEPPCADYWGDTLGVSLVVLDR